MILPHSILFSQGKAQTQYPTTTNYAWEFPTFGEIVGASASGAQWIRLAFMIMVSPLPDKYATLNFKEYIKKSN